MRRIIKRLIPRKLRIRIRLLKLNREMRLLKPLEIKNTKEVEKTIVVLGMQRSGTSLTSSILNKFGIPMGENLTTPGKDNPKGFFENEHILRMNEKILLSSRGSWDKPPKHRKIIELKKNKKLMQQIRSLVLSQQDVVWGWKDPRTILTIDLYTPFIKNPYFIICHRNPLAIGKSLTSKNNRYLIEENPMKLISIYDKRLSNFLDRTDFPRLHVNYEDYFTNPKDQIIKIRDFLRLGKNVDLTKALNLIDKRIKHF